MKKLLAALKGFLSGDFGSELVRYFAAGVITTVGNYALFAALGLARTRIQNCQYYHPCGCKNRRLPAQQALCKQGGRRQCR